jgi:hypothetical protein
MILISVLFIDIVLSSYPQGKISLMPQLMAFLALFSTLMAFPAFHFGTNSITNFMCYDLYELDDICVPLTINSPLFWQKLPSTSFKDDEWAVFIKVAAVFGVLAGGLGFLAFWLLATASCFALTSKRLKQVMLCQIISAIFSMLTLLAAKADPCQNNPFVQAVFYTDDHFNQVANVESLGCTKGQTRLDIRAVCMIFASVLHLVGFFVTNGYLAFVKEEKEALLLATQKETLALTTGRAVGEEQPLPSGTNDDNEA